MSAAQLAPPDDASLVQAVLAGDVDAYGALVDRYAAEYMRFAVRMLGTVEDADEVLHTAFYRAYQHLGSCQDPTRYGAWLYRIVVNECRTRASRRARRARRPVRDDAARARRAANDRADGQFALREELQRAIDQLPVESREAFVLKYVEELSYEEMSEITGAGISALKMRTKRACERLREILEDDRDA
jgi:RNA polymerase sigma-70 factor (ECF subfamily)